MQYKSEFDAYNKTNQGGLEDQPRSLVVLGFLLALLVPLVQMVLFHRAVLAIQLVHLVLAVQLLPGLLLVLWFHLVRLVQMAPFLPFHPFLLVYHPCQIRPVDLLYPQVQMVLEVLLDLGDLFHLLVRKSRVVLVVLVHLSRLMCLVVQQDQMDQLDHEDLVRL